MEDLDAAKLDDVKGWFQTYYGPANAVLSIAGDVDVKTIKEKVEHYFGDIPSGPPIARQGTWIAKRTGSQRGTMQDRVPQTRIYKVWNVPQWGSADGDYLSLASSVLSTGQVVPALQAAGVRRADRERRGRVGRAARDRRTVHDRGGRAAGYGPGQGRARDRRGAGTLSRRRTDGGRAPTGEDARRARDSSAASSRSAGSAANRTCLPKARCSPAGRTSTRCRCSGSPARPRPGARRGGALALGRGVHPHGRARSPTTPPAASGADRSRLPAVGDAAQGRVPGARAGDAVERPQDRARRAARDPGGALRPAARRGLRGRPVRPAGHGQPGDEHAGRGHRPPGARSRSATGSPTSAHRSARARGSTSRACRSTRCASGSTPRSSSTPT